VGFKPTTPLFEQRKTFHALDQAATVISYLNSRGEKRRHREGGGNPLNLELLRNAVSTHSDIGDRKMSMAGIVV
jgi:hypothetical protein